MSDKSKIEWTDATWNPVTGCTKVSPGCAHCYAETFARRFRGVPAHPYEQGFDLKLWPERLDLPLAWRERKMIFVNSMSDLFHEDVPDNFIAKIWEKAGLGALVVAAGDRRQAYLLDDPGQVREINPFRQLDVFFSMADGRLLYYTMTPDKAFDPGGGGERP